MMHSCLNGRQCLISVAPAASCRANIGIRHLLFAVQSELYEITLADSIYSEQEDTKTHGILQVNIHSWTHTLSQTQFPPLLDVFSFLAQGIACSEARLARGAPWPFSTQAGTQDDGHARADTHTHTHTHHCVHRHGNKRACHRGSAHAQQALVGAEERALEPWQGVTNNCSSLDMQNGPTVNLPDWYSAVCCGRTACF